MMPTKVPYDARVDRVVPSFIRLPKTGKTCPHTGLTRSVMFRLCDDGLVESKTLRRPGQLRGVRLVSYASLMAYLNSCPSGMENGGSDE